MEQRKKYRIKQDDFSSAVFNLHEYGINMYSREIFLHSYPHNESGIDGDYEPGMDYRMAATFIKNLSLLNNQGAENILLHQHSCGGDWDYGMAIFNAIANSVSPVTILAYAHARSMSSITLQAAKVRVLMPDCGVLIHHGCLGFYDRATPIVSNVKFWEEHEKPRMMEIYTDRCVRGRFFKEKKMDKAGVIKFLLRKMEKKTDWILTAEEAVYYGFADGILGDKKFKTVKSIRKEK